MDVINKLIETDLVLRYIEEEQPCICHICGEEVGEVTESTQCCGALSSRGTIYEECLQCRHCERNDTDTITLIFGGRYNYHNRPVGGLVSSICLCCLDECVDGPYGWKRTLLSNFKFFNDKAKSAADDYDRIEAILRG